MGVVNNGVDNEGNERFSKPFNGNPTLKEVITQLVEIYKKHGDMPVAIVEDEGGYIQEQHYARMGIDRLPQI